MHRDTPPFSSPVDTNPNFPEHEHLKCPRCDSGNTKFCYYNNYNLSQPRHFCKNCRRYWTKGGTLRNIPIGGGTRKITKRGSNSTKRTSSVTSPPPALTPPTPPPPPPTLAPAPAQPESEFVHRLVPPTLAPVPAQQESEFVRRLGQPTVAPVPAQRKPESEFVRRLGQPTVAPVPAQRKPESEFVRGLGPPTVAPVPAQRKPESEFVRRLGGEDRQVESVGGYPMGPFGNLLMEGLNFNLVSKSDEEDVLIRNPIGDDFRSNFLRLNDTTNNQNGGSENGWPDLSIFTPGSSFH